MQETANLLESGANSGAFDAPTADLTDAEPVTMDPDLTRLITVWPHLPDDTRREIVRLAEQQAR